MPTRQLKRLFVLLSHVRDTLVSQGPDRVLFLTTRYLSWKLRFQKRVSTLPPRINLAVTMLVITWVRCTIRLFRLFASEKYTDADPYKLIHLDPSAIEYTTGERGSKRRGWVVDGNWDRKGDRFMRRPSAVSIKQRFLDGMKWDETVLAENCNEREFERRCHRIDRLYRSIREDGYKSQRQLIEENPDAAWSDLNDSMHPLANEISVDIGRNGELLWNMCGQHRLAIAKVLDINQIPVQVFRRHEQWQMMRNKVRNDEDIPEKFLDHPDLDDLLNGD